MEKRDFPMVCKKSTDAVSNCSLNDIYPRGSARIKISHTYVLYKFTKFLNGSSQRDCKEIVIPSSKNPRILSG